MNAADTAQVIAIAQRLVREGILQAQRGTLAVPQLMPGTVIARSLDFSSVQVVIDGDANPIEVVNALDQPVQAGARVLVLFEPPHGVFLTHLLGPPSGAHTEVDWMTPGGDRTFNTAAWQDFPTDGMSVTMVKYRDDTKLVLALAANNVYTTGAPETVLYGIQVNGVDYQTSSFALPTSHRESASGFNVIDGLAAGSYVCTARCYSLGGGTIHHDGFSLFSMTVTETL